MSITVKDVADMVERVDEKLSPLTRYDGFQPYEGIYRLGDWGYVTETEYNKAFEHEDGWAQDAYILDGNGVSHTRISQLIDEDDTGKAISDYINERFNNDQMDDVFYTEATEEGECWESSSRLLIPENQSKSNLYK